MNPVLPFYPDGTGVRLTMTSRRRFDWIYNQWQWCVFQDRRVIQKHPFKM